MGGRYWSQAAKIISVEREIQTRDPHCALNCRCACVKSLTLFSQYIHYDTNRSQERLRRWWELRAAPSLVASLHWGYSNTFENVRWKRGSFHSEFGTPGVRKIYQKGDGRE